MLYRRYVFNLIENAIIENYKTTITLKPYDFLHP